MIRVRFAPSPTGFLHIGGVRTALFNYLYAKNTGGKFLVRIEDTDRERSKPEFEAEILNALQWLGLQWDEELIHQSKRLEHYQTLAQELLSKNLAYEETKENKVAIKFKVPEKQMIFEDIVHGRMEFDTSLFDDIVLIKSDGFPAFHWACAVDDHDMQISHVIRGDDHLSNTPRQRLLFEAMGWKPPKVAHLPLILGNDGTPLSKRHGAASLTHYQKEGFLPEGLLNYLALLGWGVEGGSQELFSLQELIKKFSLKRVNKTNARFDREKLEWLNGQHLKKLSAKDYVRKITEFYPELSKRFSSEKWEQLVLLYRSRIKTFEELRVQANYCFEEVQNYSHDVREKFFENKALKENLEAWAEKIRDLDAFDQHQEIEAATRQSAEACGLQAKDLIHPLRFALTGVQVSPGLFEMMSVLGKETCLQRVQNFLKP